MQVSACSAHCELQRREELLQCSMQERQTLGIPPHSCCPPSAVRCTWTSQPLTLDVTLDIGSLGALKPRPASLTKRSCMAARVAVGVPCPSAALVSEEGKVSWRPSLCQASCAAQNEAHCRMESGLIGAVHSAARIRFW